LTVEQQKDLKTLLPRLEVLTECYTKGELKNSMVEFQKLFYALYSVVINGGSIFQEVHFKNGFPAYEEVERMVVLLKAAIVKAIR
jgi:hypothetical protein